jgi:hypothetical protein
MRVSVLTTKTCMHCNSSELVEHAFCTRCFRDFGEQKVNENSFSPNYKCCLRAFINGCKANGVDLHEVYGTSVDDIHNLLRSLDERGFFINPSNATTRQELVSGVQVGDEIFSALGSWYNVTILITIPGQNEGETVTRTAYESDDPTRIVHIEWTTLDSGHWQEVAFSEWELDQIRLYASVQRKVRGF